MKVVPKSRSVTTPNSPVATSRQNTDSNINDSSGNLNQNADSIYPKYIRKVLLQFFLQDGSTREALIPVILNLVGCDENMIQKAKRSLAESNQIIFHALSLFN